MKRTSFTVQQDRKKNTCHEVVKKLVVGELFAVEEGPKVQEERREGGYRSLIGREKLYVEVNMSR